MTIRSAVSAIAMIGLVVVLTTATLAQQTSERVVEAMWVREQPVEVIAISNDGQHINFGQKFNAPDDWMSTLKFSVRNTSNKRILYAELRFFFPRPTGSQELPGSFTLFYGKYAISRRPPTIGEQTVGIVPGEIVEIGFSDQKYRDLQTFLKEARFPGVEKTALMLGMVIFDDDTGWYGQESLRRDPNDPTSWLVVRPSASKTK